MTCCQFLSLLSATISSSNLLGTRCSSRTFSYFWREEIHFGNFENFEISKICWNAQDSGAFIFLKVSVNFSEILAILPVFKENSVGLSKILPSYFDSSISTQIFSAYFQRGECNTGPKIRFLTLYLFSCVRNLNKKYACPALLSAQGGLSVF